MLQGNKKDIASLLPYVNERLQKALAYIAENDFSQLANGEYEIERRSIFARVNTYTTEEKAVRRPEKHNEYIDVQFVAEGEETIWYTPLRTSCVEVENRAEKEDVIFYADAKELNCVHLKAGDFAVFFPWELHRPNCQTEDKGSFVQKIVVKVKA